MPKAKEQAKMRRCIGKVMRQGKSRESAEDICGWSMFGRKKRKKRKSKK